MSGAARLIKAEQVNSGEGIVESLSQEKLREKALAAPAEAPKGRNATSSK